MKTALIALDITDEQAADGADLQGALTARVDLEAGYLGKDGAPVVPVGVRVVPDTHLWAESLRAVLDFHADDEDHEGTRHLAALDGLLEFLGRTA